MASGITRRDVGVSGLALIAGASLSAAAPDRLVYKDRHAPIDDRVSDLLSRMTLDEKVAQMLCIWSGKSAILDAGGEFSPERASAAWPHGLGMLAKPSDRVGFRPMGGMDNRPPADMARFSIAAQRWATERTRLGIPLFLHEEALHGLVARDATSFPQAIALASTFDPALVERAFTIAGREAALGGCNLVLAPVVDVARDPRWGRIEETYGEDPYLAGEIGCAAIRGFQGTTLPLGPDKVLATLKHFTGHGQPENGTNIGPAPFAERTLREIFFPPFEKALATLPIRSVMASYNEIDGVPSHANGWLLGRVLRQEWGFKGMIVSDYEGIAQLVSRHHVATDPLGAAKLALAAGVDVETPDPVGYLPLADWVRKGLVDAALVDTAVARVLRVKFEAGLFERPLPVPARAERQVGTPASAALAREVAAKALILLKNADATLPLDPARLSRLAVIGPNAADAYLGGYSDRPRRAVSLLEGIRAAVGSRVAIDHAEGVKITQGTHNWFNDDTRLALPEENRRGIAAAVEIARRADAIVLAIGDNEETSREAWTDNHLGDRAGLDLIGEQQALFDALAALGKPIVVVLIGGRPLSITAVAERAQAIVQVWYPGQEGGHAIADVLFGRRNPGGKLPVSVARHVGQLPVFYDHKPSARRGYLFDTTKPLFPFGFGLSYSRFAIGAPVLGTATIGVADTVEVAVTVRNIGDRAGDEVVQLYLRDDVSSVTRPVLELKGFRRVTLAPGEATTVRFPLGPDALGFWNAEMKRVVEPGTFTVSAGASSVDLKSVSLTVV